MSGSGAAFGSGVVSGPAAGRRPLRTIVTRGGPLGGDAARVIAVAGCGASGMAAAVAVLDFLREVDAGAGGRAYRLICLEKNPEPGRKLLATGNGRCNLTNAACDEAETVLKFFRGLGILPRREAGGRIYPHSGQAAAVRDALRAEIARGGGEMRTGLTVKAARHGGRGFEIETEEGPSFSADCLILATGGKAGPQYGCAGDGYRLARGFGHSLVSPLPALVQMVCAEGERERVSALKGVRASCAATLMIGEEAAGEAAGEVQFTDRGLSGICVFDLSRLLRGKDQGPCRLLLDFAPDYSLEELAGLLSENRAARLAGIVPLKLAGRIEAEARGDARIAAAALKAMSFAVSGTKGWKEAQVTSGGVPLDEIDPATMASKRVPGLYFAGEILDYDGRCGGFNLHWAWISGMKAGRAAARRLTAPAAAPAE